MDAAYSMSQHPMFILAMKNNLIQHLPYFNLHHHSRTHNNHNNNNNINYNRVTDNLCYSWWFFLLFLILIITTESSSTTLTTTATSTTLTCSPRQIKTLQFDDAGAKAYISQVVFKGFVKSRTPIDQQGLYEASFLILQPLKGFPPITKKKRRRVQFASGNSASCKQGVITSNLDINVTYLVFADRAGGHQLRALASPLLATRRHEESVERSLNSSCVQAPTVQLKRDVQVREKERLRLVCKFDGVPLPHIEWYRKGRRVEPTNKRARIRITFKKRRSTLAIHKVSQNDAGKYECRAVSATDEKACTSTQVTVTAAVEPPHIGATNNDNATTHWPWMDAPCPISSYCLNGGTCRYYEAVGELVCECAEGYKGQRCESKDVYNRGTAGRGKMSVGSLLRGARTGGTRHGGGGLGHHSSTHQHYHNHHSSSSRGGGLHVAELLCVVRVAERSMGVADVTAAQLDVRVLQDDFEVRRQPGYKQDHGLTDVGNHLQLHGEEYPSPALTETPRFERMSHYRRAGQQNHENQSMRMK